MSESMTLGIAQDKARTLVKRFVITAKHYSFETRTAKLKMKSAENPSAHRFHASNYIYFRGLRHHEMQAARMVANEFNLTFHGGKKA